LNRRQANTARSCGKDNEVARFHLSVEDERAVAGAGWKRSSVRGVEFDFETGVSNAGRDLQFTCNALISEILVRWLDRAAKEDLISD
jgi:hypothetical protein